MASEGFPDSSIERILHTAHTLVTHSYWLKMLFAVELRKLLVSFQCWEYIILSVIQFQIHVMSNIVYLDVFILFLFTKCGQTDLLNEQIICKATMT